MHHRKVLLVHVAAWAACLSINACGAFEQSNAGNGTSTQNQSTTQTSASIGENANTYANNPNTDIPATTAGNTNSATSPNTATGTTPGSGTGGGNTTNANITTPPLTCDKTWTNYAQAFFTSNCADCHNHNHAPLTSYNTVVGEAPTIKLYISSKIMPVGTTLPAGDYNTILNWFDCNMPR